MSFRSPQLTLVAFPLNQHTLGWSPFLHGLLGCSAPASLGRFVGTTKPSDFSAPCILGLPLSRSRGGPTPYGQANAEISRFSRLEFPRMPRSSTPQGPRLAGPYASPGVAFRRSETRRLPDCGFRGSIARPACTPVNASPTPSRRPAHDSGPLWGTTLQRKTLPFSTPSRFIPARSDGSRSAQGEAPPTRRGRAQREAPEPSVAPPAPPAHGPDGSARLRRGAVHPAR
jgi:hypothetical protein